MAWEIRENTICTRPRYLLLFMYPPKFVKTSCWTCSNLCVTYIMVLWVEVFIEWILVWIYTGSRKILFWTFKSWLIFSNWKTWSFHYSWSRWQSTHCINRSVGSRSRHLSLSLESSVFFMKSFSHRVTAMSSFLLKLSFKFIHPNSGKSISVA